MSQLEPVFSISSLPASASTSDTFDYHHFRRIFTVGETNVPATDWQYLGQSNHPAPTSGQYLIQAFLRIGAGDVPLNTALTSGGVWDQQNQRFTTKPTENILDGMVYDRSDLPADAVTSTQYDYWQYNRYYTEGEGTVAGSAWWRVGKLDQDAGGGGTTLTPEQIADINRIDQIASAVTANDNAISGKQDSLTTDQLDDINRIDDIESAKQDKIENDDGSDPAEGQIAIVDSAGKLVLGNAPSGGGSGATTFDGLTDTPTSKEANKLVATNADGDALEYVDKTPDADTTTKGIVERATTAEVEAGADATRYVAPASLRTELSRRIEGFADKTIGSDVPKDRLPDIDFTDLADTPDSLGTAGQIAAVNSTEDGIEFINAPTGGGGGASTYTETDIAISSTSPNTATRQEVANGTSYDKIYVSVKLGTGAWVQGTSNANLRYGGEIIVSHLGSGSANSTNFVGIGRGANNYALNAYISGTTVVVQTLDLNATAQLNGTSILKITGVNF